MIFLKALSFWSNFLASSRNYCLISSDPIKIPSRYYHFFWTTNHTSMISEILFNAYSQCLILFKKAETYLLLATAYRLASWSSRSCLISSVYLRTNPLSSLPFLYFTTSNEADFHTYSILEISSSFLCSWLASVQISLTFSGNLWRFRANTYSKVIDLIEVSNLTPVSFISFSQCLSVMAPPFNYWMSGIESLNSVIRLDSFW